MQGKSINQVNALAGMLSASTEAKVTDWQAGDIGWIVRKLGSNTNLRTTPEIGANIKRVLPAGTVVRIYVVKSQVPSWPMKDGGSPNKGFYFIEAMPEGVGQFWSAYALQYPPKNIDAWNNDTSGLARMGFISGDLPVEKVPASALQDSGGGGSADSKWTTGANEGSPAGSTEGGGVLHDPKEQPAVKQWTPDGDAIDPTKSDTSWLWLLAAVAGWKINLLAGAAMASYAYISGKKNT